MVNRLKSWGRKTLKFFFNLVGLRIKLMGIILLVVVIFGGISIWQVQASMVDVLRQQLDNQGISIAQYIAASSVDYIYTNNIFSLYKLVEDTLTYNHDIKYAFIIDPDGKVLVSSFGRGVPNGLISNNQVSGSQRYHLQMLNTEDGLIHDVAVPIDGGRAGFVRIGMTETNLWAAVTSLTHRLLLIILSAALLGLAAALVLTVIVSSPILALARTAKTIEAGNLNCRVSLEWAQDEIGQLALAFNNMMDSLQDYHARVEDFNQTLLQRNDALQHLSEELMRKEEMRTYLLQKVISAQEEERHRIARELHDQTSQSLTSLIVGLKNLEDASDMPKVREGILSLRDLTDEILEEVHNLALELRPRVLDDLGLPAGLQRYCRDSAKRYAIDIDLHMEGFEGRERLAPVIENTLYRVVQESITNIAKHARAHNVSVILERWEDRVLAIVEDDGCGFDIAKVLENPMAEKKLGIFGMQERVALLEGKMTIESEPGQGSTLYFEVPLKNEGGDA